MAGENITPNLFQGRTQKRGARGEDIAAMQRNINKAYAGNPDFTPLKEDGIYGPKTEAAFQQFQNDYGVNNAGAKLGVMADYQAKKPTPADQSNFAMPNIQEKPVQESEKVQEKAESTPKDANNDVNGIDSMRSLFTTPEQEEKLRKSSIAKQRILAIGDALRHLGNVYYASKGAVPQKFNNPLAEEQARYKQEKAERDANNAKVISYQEMKAKQEEDKRRWQADYGIKVADLNDKAAQRAAERERWAKQDQETANYHAGLLGINQKKADDARELGEQRNNNLASYYDVMGRAALTNAGANATRASETKRINDWKIENGRGRYATPNGGISFDRPLDKQQVQQLYAEGVRKKFINSSAADKQRVQTILRQQGKPYDDYHVKEYQALEALSGNQDLGNYAVRNFRGKHNTPQPKPQPHQPTGNAYGGTRHGSSGKKSGNSGNVGKGNFRVTQAN